MKRVLGKIGWGTLGTLLVMAPLFASSAKGDTKAASAPAAYNWAHAEEASNLLRQVRRHSVQLADSAMALQIHAGFNQLGWESHGASLNTIRDHFNAMGRNLDRLQEIQTTIAPWQQKAVERIIPSSVALGAHTERAIEHLNRHQDNFWLTAYRDSVSAMAVHAESINDSVNSFLDYEQTAERLEVLERQIEYAGA